MNRAKLANSMFDDGRPPWLFVSFLTAGSSVASRTYALFQAQYRRGRSDRRVVESAIRDQMNRAIAEWFEERGGTSGD